MAEKIPRPIDKKESQETQPDFFAAQSENLIEEIYQKNVREGKEIPRSEIAEKVQEQVGDLAESYRKKEEEFRLRTLEAAEKNHASWNVNKTLRNTLLITWLGMAIAYGWPAADVALEEADSEFVTTPLGHRIYTTMHPEVLEVEAELKKGGIEDPEQYDHYRLSLQEAQDAARITEQLGRSEMSSLLNIPSIKTEAERAKLLEDFKPNIEGLETFDDLGKPTVAHLFKEQTEKTMPKGFQYNVHRIEYTPEIIPMPADDGPQLAVNGGPEVAHANPGGEIIFSGGSATETISTLSGSLIHEEVHESDWIRNRLLTRSERLHLLRSVIGRIHTKDRYLSRHYVEKIQNSDKHREDLIRALEYFAEIGEAYFDEKPLPAKDAAIIHDLVQKSDPSFNNRYAHSLRIALASQATPIPLNQE